MTTMLVPQGIVFPEGARWHDGKLWLSDTHGHRVLTVDPDGKLEVVAEVDDRPSGLGFLPDGTPVVAMVRSLRLVCLRNGKAVLHADLSSLGGHNLNDMVVDGEGRAYANYRFKDPPDTIVMVRPDGSFETVAEGLERPNGTAVTPDGRTLIVSETMADRLTAYTVSPDGRLSDRRVFAKLHGLPDGICLDAEGAVWVGMPLAFEFVRVREGGEILQRVSFSDGKWAIAPALGDADRKTLYMLTAFHDFEDRKHLVDFESDLKSKSRGFVETLRVSTPGVGWP